MHVLPFLPSEVGRYEDQLAAADFSSAAERLKAEKKMQLALASILVPHSWLIAVRVLARLPARILELRAPSPGR